MSKKSKIEWTDASWNPVSGCRKISPGCQNCYAEKIAERFRGVENHHYEKGFDIQIRPGRLKKPEEWKKPHKIFVNSMSDIFLEEVPADFINDIFRTMLKVDRHIYQLLSKRSKGMLEWCTDNFDSNNPIPKHIWMGVSVEDEDHLYRIEDLKKIPAETKFISFEPLLNSTNLGKENLEGIDWVIVGGESGWSNRPMKLKWVDEIFEICQQCDISFFFKQWGTFNSKGERVGKKKAGKKYRGKYWNGFPEIT